MRLPLKYLVSNSAKLVTTVKNPITERIVIKIFSLSLNSRASRNIYPYNYHLCLHFLHT